MANRIKKPKSKKQTRLAPNPAEVANGIYDGKAKKKHAGGQKKIDWYAARNDYLTDNTMAYSDIAKKYGCTKNAVLARAKQEAWPELRRDLSERAFDDFRKQLLDKKATAQSEHLTSYQNMRALANRAIQEAAVHNYARDRRGNFIFATINAGKTNERTEPIPVPLNPFELEKLAKALHSAIVGERIVLGLPSSVNALTDSEGGDVFKGLSDLVLKAREKPDESNSTASGQ